MSNWREPIVRSFCAAQRKLRIVGAKQLSGATREQLDIPNVLFIGAKVKAMQRLIAKVPDGSERS